MSSARRLNRGTHASVRLADLTLTPQLPVRIDHWTDQLETFAREKLSKTCTRATAQFVIWQGMDTLVQQGKIIYVGSSNFAGWHITQANERAIRSRLIDGYCWKGHFCLAT